MTNANGKREWGKANAECEYKWVKWVNMNGEYHWRMSLGHVTSECECECVSVSVSVTGECE